MKLTTLTSVLLMLAAPAFAQSSDTNSTMETAPSGAATAASSSSDAANDTEMAPATAEFVEKAARSDMFEIQSSQLAAGRTDGATKDFAEQMVNDHQKTTKQLKDLVTSGSIDAELPTAMSQKQQDMLDELRSLDADAFATQYRNQQVNVHEKAVELFDQYGNRGDDEALRQWAAETLPTLRDHLQMARDLPE
ncbi:DUF4142 domain-containing protein [Rhizobium sp. L1K21]|uniref:DUF4142 domain-containing protein n=1 Tax=Rhizobium sp. L1K21 TaxID=2954933 RepID=UPI002093D6AE|nr:DUF4142 domain-containing protein [Rhizobium sp. L1K21]MCO6187771.1 DUF4142 domain-containing protein [Rhizobium sp. L1K21]